MFLLNKVPGRVEADRVSQLGQPLAEVAADHGLCHGSPLLQRRRQHHKVLRADGRQKK